MLDEDFDDDDDMEDNSNIIVGSGIYEAPEIHKLVIGDNGSDNSKKIVLFGSQRKCVGDMLEEIKKGQMLVLLHGPPGSGKTTTAQKRAKYDYSVCRNYRHCCCST